MRSQSSEVQAWWRGALVEGAQGEDVVAGAEVLQAGVCGVGGEGDGGAGEDPAEAGGGG